MSAPLRKIMSRKFVAYEGTHLWLQCGHTVVRNARRANLIGSVRCEECALDEARERFLDAMGETVDLSHPDEARGETL